MKKVIKTLTCASVYSFLTLSWSKTKLQPETDSNFSKSEAYDFRKDAKLLAISEYDTKDAINAKQYNNVDMEKINAIYWITPGSNRIATFSLLDVNEKFAYWDNLTETKIENLTISVDKKELLFDFQKLAVKRVMYQPTQGGDNARANLLASLPNVLIPMNNQGIETELFLDLFYSSNRGGFNFIPSDNQNGGGGLQNCSCNKGSIINPIKMQRCGEECLVSGSGCGFFGMFMCNGRPGQLGPRNTKDFLDTP